MNKNRPLGITLIGYFYILGSITLFLSLALGTKQEIAMNIRFGVPNIPEIIVVISVMLFSLIMSYGYLKMKIWGYWCMIIYSILFLLINLKQLTMYNSQPFIGNAIFSIIVLIYTFIKRSNFISTIKLTQQS